jgi:2,3-bisphosphoglycerate-independent phosphoglycerate mutase
MSRYNSEFPFPVAFPPQPMTNVLAEWLGAHEIKQAHVAGTPISLSWAHVPYHVLAETEKYAHVTFFFNGGVEKQFPLEERFMIPSPKVRFRPNFDLPPRHISRRSPRTTNNPR